MPLASDASPAAVVAQLSEEDHPGALWGDWFDGGLLIFRRPLRVAEPLNATDGFECLDDQPLVVDPNCDPALSVADGLPAWDTTRARRPWRSMTHRCAGCHRRGWRFESLGSTGREQDDVAALEYWNAVLSAAPYARIEPVQVGTFGVSTDGGICTRSLPRCCRERDQPNRSWPLLPAEPLYPTRMLR